MIAKPELMVLGARGGRTVRWNHEFDGDACYGSLCSDDERIEPESL